MPSVSLSPRQRQHLKGLAHSLSPVVQVGAAGVSEAVVRVVGEALYRHELIKIKLPKLDDAAAREAMAEALTAASGAARIQLVGRVLVLYTPRDKDLPKKPRIQVPSA
ncbi:RNA-binding protein YhbY [Enhygromyxa salina]|uniref:RNA-binding protein YhbY n=1 Tax=Enhygromyxa salina TaxID=215803 RepID=A0A2S9XG93_9BACT|nr:ribosome assembly RNA-binding protein YhbY [Enhygromyxa salina]PRP91886.1 RNA-binding protein YhbY [Enhygromyxa salina]